MSLKCFIVYSFSKIISYVHVYVYTLNMYDHMININMYNVQFVIVYNYPEQRQNFLLA